MIQNWMVTKAWEPGLELPSRFQLSVFVFRIRVGEPGNKANIAGLYELRNANDLEIKNVHTGFT